ncbi:MAG: hypothetical protein K2M91_08955, partial [Lachnospiraceae bacterium]|nr:hypothetical protein [Lachnospiraceae bacterium]
YQTYYCENCGNATEIDGIWNIPFEIKQAIMMQEGEFVLVSTERNNRAKIMYLLKKMPCGDSALYKLFKEGKTDKIFSGTKNEMTFMKNYLITKGLKENMVEFLSLSQGRNQNFLEDV